MVPSGDMGGDDRANRCVSSWEKMSDAWS